jgi:transcriptional regulator with XRE-family HTH domain
MQRVSSLSVEICSAVRTRFGILVATARLALAVQTERHGDPLSQEELAELAGVAPRTVSRLENPFPGQQSSDESVAKIRAALESLGVEFIEGERGYWGVRIKT